jgi:hypothetical protein
MTGGIEITTLSRTYENMFHSNLHHRSEWRDETAQSCSLSFRPVEEFNIEDKVEAGETVQHYKQSLSPSIKGRENG